MISFKEYHEGFNPLSWFRQQENQMRSNAQNSEKYIKPLLDLLHSRNYEVIKSDRGSYTARLRRVVALDPSEDKKTFGKIYNNDKILSSPEIRKLFTLAHEVGHVLQWDEETDTKFKFQEFYDAQNNSETDLKDLHTLWYELDAWVQGMQFIPMEYKQKYKRYAYDSYKSYMDNSPKSYGNEMLLRNMLYQLNADEQ